MIKRLKFFLAFIFLISISVSISFGQTKEDLQKKKENIQKEIDAMQKELDKTKKSKTSSLSEVKVLQQKTMIVIR